MNITNLYKNIPYQKDEIGKRKLVDKKELLMIQVALLSKQEVPPHNANADVNIIVLKGALSITLDKELFKLEQGDLILVKRSTYMEIKNILNEEASFLIIKAPNPNF